MAKKPTSAKDDAPLNTIRIEKGYLQAYIRGTSPLIYNRMAAKARRELLLPSGPKNAATKAANLKHDPIQEYRDSAHRLAEGPTLLALPSPAFKGAMATAALRLPGVTKTEMVQLLWVEGYAVETFGVPQMIMAVVRMADISRTPDIRTRAILPEWCCKITVSYLKPMLNAKTVQDLLAGAGYISGVGDFRQEKGKGNFGQFELVNEGDEAWERIAKTQGRAAQEAAMQNPEHFDLDTADLYNWFADEVLARGRQATVAEAAPANDRRRRVTKAAA